MKKTGIFTFGIIILALIVSCGRGMEEKKQPVLVFAAASLNDAVSELAKNFERQGEIVLRINFASSGTLARQIEQGELPHLYLSASKKWADYIDSLGLIENGLQKNIATNELVLIAPVYSNIDSVSIDSTFDIRALLGEGRISMGDPLHVPAGKYARQALEYYGWYSSLESRILPSKDVRSALMVTEMGETPLGIVYKTDAQKSAKVKIVGTFAEVSHKPITYVAAVCSPTEDAIRFYAYLTSDSAQVVWDKYGFTK